MFWSAALAGVTLLVVALFLVGTRPSVALHSQSRRSFVVFLMPSPFDLVSTYTRFIGWWEGWLHGLFDVILQISDGVALDVGANIGCHSLILSQSTRHNVWAFEPQSAPCAALRRSIIANGINNIEVFQTALGAEVGPNSMRPLGAVPLGSGAVRIGKGGENIHMTTLDSLWRERGQPHIAFAKIDVEGFETEVLKGARACLASCPPIVFEDWGTSTQAYLKKHCGYTRIIRLRHPWLGFVTNDFLAYKHNNMILSKFLDAHRHEEI